MCFSITFERRILYSLDSINALFVTVFFFDSYSMKFIIVILKKKSNKESVVINKSPV